VGHRGVSVHARALANSGEIFISYLRGGFWALGRGLAFISELCELCRAGAL